MKPHGLLPESMPSIPTREAYPSDLSDAQWDLVRDLIPKSSSNTTIGGHPTIYSKREIVNAILYVARTGCQWRFLPHDLPYWKTVYDYFVEWHNDGIFEKINTKLRRKVRVKNDRNPDPSAGIIDSQSVKIPANIGFSGFDGAKKVNGRKRHIVTDTLGLLLTVHVHEASTQDRAAAYDIIKSIKTKFKSIKTIFTDQGYTGVVVEKVRTAFNITLDVVRRIEARTFHVLPRRWVVERTFGWFGFYRRLAKDYERQPAHSEAFVFIAMSNIMLLRLSGG